MTSKFTVWSASSHKHKLWKAAAAAASVEVTSKTAMSVKSMDNKATES